MPNPPSRVVAIAKFRPRGVVSAASRPWTGSWPQQWSARGNYGKDRERKNREQQSFSFDNSEAGMGLKGPFPPFLELEPNFSLFWILAALSNVSTTNFCTCGLNAKGPLFF